MEDKTARIRINFSIGEIEIEGTETFVREHVDKYENLFEFWRKESRVKSVPQEIATSEKVPAQAERDLPEVFGDYLQKFPKSITNIDKVLMAGYFIQSHEPDKCFTRRNANILLTEQGYKVSNPSDSVNQSKKSKRIFAVPSEGKGKFRVSQDGIDYINGLQEVPDTSKG